MRKEVPRLAISDSCIGVASTRLEGQYTEMFVEGVLERLRENGYGPISVEMLAWWGSEKVIRRQSIVDASGFEIAELHGRLGGGGNSLFDKMKVAGANSALAPTGALLDKDPDGSFLFHRPEAEEQFHSIVSRAGSCDIEILYSSEEVREGSDEFVESFQNGSFIWVENGVGGCDELKKSIEIVREMRCAGVNSGFMLDVAHFMLGSAPDYLFDRKLCTQQFSDTMSLLSDNFEALGCKSAIPIGLHLEVGETRDSIPLELFQQNTEMQLLSEAVINAGVSRIVIENQQGGLGMVVTRKRDLDKIYGTFARVMEGLDTHGVLCALSESAE